MSKADATAYNGLLELVNKGQTIQIQKNRLNYEITVWSDGDINQLNHIHYQGETLMEAIMKATK